MQRVATLLATESTTPAAISSRFAPFPIKLITSDSVDFADKIITEITCHGKGGTEIAKGDCTIIDIGGQDTKVIIVENNFIA